MSTTITSKRKRLGAFLLRQLNRVIRPQHYDIWVSIGGLIFGVLFSFVLLKLGLTQPLGLPVVVLVFSSGYLLLRGYLTKPLTLQRPDPQSPDPESPDPVALQPDNNKRQPWTHLWQQKHSQLVALSLVLFTSCLSLWTIYSSINTLKRPAWTFFVLAGLPTFILAQQFFLRSSQPLRNALRAQMVIFALTVVYSGVFVYPHAGGDTWGSIHHAEEVVHEHTIKAVPGAYKDYPLYPAFLAVASMLTGLEVGEVGRLFNVLVTIACLLLLYDLSLQFGASTYQSLVFGLMLLSNKWFVYWLMLIVSMATGMVIYCLYIVMLFRRLYRERGPGESLILVMMTGVIAFFHPLISMVFIMVTLGFRGVEMLIRIFQKTLNHRTMTTLAIFLAVAVLTHWIYYGQYVFDRTVSVLLDAIFADGESSAGGGVKIAASYRSLLSYTYDQLNFYFLFALAGVEALRQLRANDQPFYLHATLIGLLFIGFGYAIQVINLQEALPHRWFLFGTLLLLYPASSALIRLFRAENRFLGVLLMLFMSVYAFTGIANTEANRDRPFYDESITALFEMTESERVAMVQLDKRLRTQQSNIMVDFRLYDFLKATPDENSRLGYWKYIKIEAYNGIFPVRRAYYERTLLVGDTAFNIVRDRPNLAQVYDSGDIQIMDQDRYKRPLLFWEGGF